MTTIKNNPSLFQFAFISIYNFIGLAFITLTYQLIGFSAIFNYTLVLFTLGFVLFTWLGFRKRKPDERVTTNPMNENDGEEWDGTWTTAIE